MNNFDTFVACYEKHLTVCVQENVNQAYWYTVDKVPEVVVRMADALRKRSVNIDSPAFKRTCKELGIKHTQKAMYAYLFG